MQAQNEADLRRGSSHHAVRTMAIVSGTLVGATLGLVGGLVGVAAAGLIGATVGALAGVLLERMIRREEPLKKKTPRTEREVSALIAKLDHVDPGSVPAIEPPCQACEDIRHSSGGKLTRCKRHRQAPVQTHLHYAYPPPFGLGWTFIRP